MYHWQGEEALLFDAFNVAGAQKARVGLKFAPKNYEFSGLLY